MSDTDGDDTMSPGEERLEEGTGRSTVDFDTTLTKDDECVSDAPVVSVGPKNGFLRWCDTKTHGDTTG